MTGPSCPKIYEAVLRRLHSLRLPARTRILDAPCGEGELAALLVQEGWEVFGADIAGVSGGKGRAALGDRFRVADLNRPLPWPAASFDVVVCVEGIEHLENPSAFLREAARVCRPGGRLVLTTPNIAGLRSRVRYLGSGFFDAAPRPLDEGRRDPLHHIGLLTFSELRYFLHAAGFRIEQVGHTHAKPVSYLYAVFVPWICLYTRIALRKEKNPLQRERNREIRRALLSPALFFGENLLVVAGRC